MACATFVRKILIPMLVLGVAIAHAQTLTKVAGDGQLVIQAIQSSNPLIVLLRDSSGNPIPNVLVKWTVSSGPGNAQVLSPPGNSNIAPGLTGPNGEAQASFVATVPNPQQSYVPSTITASYESASVQFTEISVGTTNNTPNVQAFPTPLPSAGILTGPAGAQGSVPINVQFTVIQGPQSGQGVGGVGVSISMDNPNDASTISCADGINYSNGAGAATCNLVYGGKIGEGSFTLSAGGLQNYDYTYKVVAGAPAVINIISGNNQSGTAGKTLPSPLVAQLTDIGGNTLADVPMAFTSIPAGALTFSNFNTTTDSTGRISAEVTLGNVSGPVQAQLATLSAPIVSTLFNITVNILVAGMSYVSGSQQSALEGVSFPNPLVVEVTDPNGNPVQGAPVTFSLSSGSATLSATSVNTNANGDASITVTAGQTAGPVVIIASTSTPTATYTQTFNLTVTPPGPVCDTNLADNDTFFNGASYAPNFMAPGGIALIYCQGIANGIQGVVTSNDFGFGPLPYQVQGVTVQFNPPSGPYAPIYYLANQNNQQWVAIQVPFGVLGTNPSGTNVPVTVMANGEPNIGNLMAPMMAGAPGFLEYEMSDGVSRAILVRPDGSVVDVKNNPAQPGDTLRAFVTGLIPPMNSSGTSEIGTNDFAPSDSDITITTPVVMGINHAGIAPPTSVIYAHDLIGVWEVTFQVPSNAPTGSNIPLDIGIPDPTNDNKLILNKVGSKIPIQ